MSKFHLYLPKASHENKQTTQPRTVLEIGHGQALTIGDAGTPGFLDTLDVVLSEMQVEEAIIATEMEEVSVEMHEAPVGLRLTPTPF